MDIYKEKFTSLEREILRFLFINTGKNFNQRLIANSINVSPTAVSNSIKRLVKKDLIKVKKDKISKTLEIDLNLDNSKAYYLKRVENLKMIYDSGLVDFLIEKNPGTTIILFGSFSRGEDIFSSDIDIAIIGSDRKNISLEKYEKILFKKISLQYYNSFNEIHKNIKEGLLNGILLKGGVQL